MLPRRKGASPVCRQGPRLPGKAPYTHPGAHVPAACRRNSAGHCPAGVPFGTQCAPPLLPAQAPWAAGTFPTAAGKEGKSCSHAKNGRSPVRFFFSLIEGKCSCPGAKGLRCAGAGSVSGRSWRVPAGSWLCPKASCHKKSC
nr:MAG TPA: hypothetical protein [Caudoviricetes sp.]